MIRSFVEQHGSIGNRECRELLGLGNSLSAMVITSRILKRCDFLEPYGTNLVWSRLLNKVRTYFEKLVTET